MPDTTAPATVQYSDATEELHGELTLAMVGEYRRLLALFAPKALAMLDLPENDMVLHAQATIAARTLFRGVEVSLEIIRDRAYASTTKLRGDPRLLVGNSAAA